MLLLFIFSILNNSVRPSQQGWTQWELAHVLIRQYNVKYAITMDGGSSSTMIRYTTDEILDDQEGTYERVNQPKCRNIPFVTCQRPVATVMCIARET